MGGKSKQANRTKNNARPSSSGRSAELLGTFNKGVVGGTALFPTLAAAAAPDAMLNPDLALCIKKLNKKDPITKTKALQELNELITNSKVEDVVAMLPNWTYFYRTLTVDPDRKVRELTQVCHGTLVSTCGRQVAPVLKALLPSWLAAQHDEHAPARSRARLTLRSTFPENKLSEAISFCRTEVLTHMMDNILDSSATISKKLDNEEERSAAATRVSCGALGGLRYFAQRLPGAHDEWLWTELASLLKTNAFWKLAGHSAPEVRSAWYNATGALAGRFGSQWGSAHGARALRLLLQARESGGAATALWAALLANFRADPEWYSRLEKKELLSKRIIESLESGGWGSARAVADALPPLLRELPPAALTSAFCTALFDACFAGLEKRNIISSKSERGAWIAGIGECVHVLAERTDLPTDIAPSALGRWLRCVLGHSAPDMRATLVATLEPMLRSWARIQRLELLLRSFWQNVASTIVKQLQELAPSADDATLRDLLDAHSLLLITLHEALQEKPKKKKGVTFSDENDQSEDTETKPLEIIPREVDKSEAEARSLLEHQLSECVRRVCAQYAARAREAGRARAVLAGLLPLLQLMGSEDVWTAMGGALTTGPASSFALWELGLGPWLRSERACCAEAVSVTFMLLPHLTAEQQAAVFSAFEELDSPVSDWALPQCVRCAWAGARAWGRSGPARAAMLRCARAALGGAAAARDTLLACLAPDDRGEIFASDETVSEISQLVSYVIQSGGATDTAVVTLAAQLVRLLSARGAAGADDLLAALLKHDLSDPDEQSASTPERDSDTRTAWREGVRAMPAGKQRPLIQRLVKLLRDHIHTDSSELEVPRILRCASLSAALATASAEGDAVTELLLEGDDNTVALTHALRLDIVAGRMNCPFDDVDLVRAAISDSSELTVPAFVPFARRCVLRAALARALGAQCARCPLEAGAHAHAFLELLHRHALVRALKDGYAFNPVYDLIASTDEHLSSLIADISALTPEHALHHAFDQLARKAAAEGFYWAYAAALYRAPDSQTDYSQIVTGDGFFHGLQAEMRLLNNDPSTESSPERLYAAHATMLRCLRAAHAAADPALAGIDPRAPPAADALVDAYYRREQSMLYDTEIHSAPWSEAVCAATVADFLCEVVAAQGWEAPPHHWDFATISLSSLLASVDKSKDHWGTVQVSMVSRAVLRLLRAVCRFVAAVAGASLRAQPAAHVAALPREWADVFAPTAAHHVYSLLLRVLSEAESDPNAPMTVQKARVVSALCEAVGCVRWAELPAASRAAFPLARVAGLAGGVLAARAHHGYKYLAYYTLDALQKPIVLEDAEKLRAWSAANSGEEGGEEEGDTPPPALALHYFDPALSSLQQQGDAALAHLRAGEDTCETVPLSAPHALALGWLLLAEALGAQARLQRADLALHHAELLRARRHADLLLPNALRLLPASVAAYATDPASGAATAPPKEAADLFLAVKHFTIDEPSLAADVAGLACRALFTAVSGYGAGAARGWVGAAGHREARALTRVVRAYVTPHLVKTQLKAVAERSPKDLPDCDVIVHWSRGEVTCCVFVEERRVEISVALSAEHPLSLPRVLTPPPHQHSPAPNTHWLAVYLAYQNGSLLNALKMWVSAVTARVEAASQCYICYCRLHPANGRLPSVTCHQCRNKFHPICLRKWFVSSSKSNCPLCRSTF